MWWHSEKWKKHIGNFDLGTNYLEADHSFTYSDPDSLEHDLVNVQDNTNSAASQSFLDVSKWRLSDESFFKNIPRSSYLRPNFILKTNSYPLHLLINRKTNLLSDLTLPWIPRKPFWKLKVAQIKTH